MKRFLSILLLLCCLCRTILRKDFLDDRAISVELYGVCPKR